MQLALTDEQKLLCDSLDRLLRTESGPARVRAAEVAGFDRDLWAKLLEFGIPAMRAPAEAGGGGMGLLDTVFALELAGRHLASVPLAEAIVAARLLAENGSEWFHRMLGGEVLATLALHDASHHPVQVVPGAAIADAVLYLDEDELVLRVASPANAPAPNLGKSALARLDLTAKGEGVSHLILANGPEVRAGYLAAVEEWKLLTAAAMAGLGRRALELAAAYATEREAFGRPIGTYQGVSHPLADSITDIEGAELLVRRAIWAIERGRPDAAASVSMAFWWASQSVARAVQRSLRTFGGYGLSVEYDIQLYFRRGKAMALPLGDPERELVRAADRLWRGESVPMPDAGPMPLEFDYGEKAEAFATEIAQFFATNLMPDVRARMHGSHEGYDPEIMPKLAEAGLLFPEWPAEFGGRGRGAYEMSALAKSFEDAGWSRIIAGTTNMGARVTLAFGSDALKAEVLPGIAAGKAFSCLGFTEPHCGSDMYAARTRAVRDGDDWVINGQKMFTTGAHLCDYVLLLTRTDPDLPKHKGLTMFLVPLKLPGVAIQAVHTLSDERTNITFYQDVRVPDRYRVGPINGAIAVMAKAMEIEHSGEGYHVSRPALLHAAVAWARSATGEDGAPRIDDPLVRARLARVAVHEELADLLCRRAVWAGVERIPSRAWGPMSKLFTTETYMRDAADLLELAAPDSLFEGHDPVGIIEHKHRHAIANTIYGGTSEIHRSVVAEQALGLPRTRA